MNTIYKYIMPMTNHIGPGRVDSVISMPKHAAILCVQEQQEVPCIWALVNTTMPMEERHFTVYGTGKELPSYPGKYIGTVQLNCQSTVLHVFERV